MSQRSIIVLLALRSLLACSTTQTDTLDGSAQGGAASVAASSAAAGTSASPAPIGTVSAEPEDDAAGAPAETPADEVAEEPSLEVPTNPAAPVVVEPVAEGEPAGSAGAGGSPEVGSAGAPGTVDVEVEVVDPCAGMPDGVYCGGDLLVPGDDSTSYACSGGVTAGVYPCSGKCSQGSCSSGNGATEGSKGAVVEGCDECTREKCAVQGQACWVETTCWEHNYCDLGCSSEACRDECELGYPPNAVYDAWRQCRDSKCGQDCAPT